jgi:SOS-response transcriptional repressor LexA
VNAYALIERFANRNGIPTATSNWREGVRQRSGDGAISQRKRTAHKRFAWRTRAAARDWAGRVMMGPFGCGGAAGARTENLSEYIISNDTI